MNSKIDNSNNYFEERINNLSLKINYNLEIIKDVCSRINSFDLISYIFFIITYLILQNMPMIEEINIFLFLKLLPAKS